MKGLIRKDFYLLWRYCWLMPLLLLAFIVFSVFSSGGQSPFFIYYPCILSSVIPVNLLAYDDAEHWLTYCDTLPVTRRQYVCGKYIMSLLCDGTVFLLSAIAAVIRLCRNGAFCPADLTDQLAVLATISLLSSALTMPPLFKFGAQKGRIVFIGLVGIFCGLTAYDTQAIKMMMMNYGGEVNESTMKLALLGSLRLYLDFVNLFLYLLRIFGSSNKE